MDVKEILRKYKYEDFFSNDIDEAKKQYRQYIKKYHPDTDNSEHAKEMFLVIRTLYESHSFVSQGVCDGGNTVTFRNKTTGKGFSLTNAFMINNNNCEVYHTLTKICIVFNEKCKVFYDNYIKAVDKLSYRDKDMEAEFKRYMPKIIKHFQNEDDRYIILLEKTSEVLNLGKIVEDYISLGKQFPEKQAAWILNRLYNLCAYFKLQDESAFNGIALENIWVSPELHSVLFLNGFEYNIKLGEKMIGVPKEVFNTMSIKTKDSKLSSTLTDLESVKQVGRRLFANRTDLKHITNFLNSGTSDDIFEEWDKYGKAIRAEFGKREFITWEDVPYIKKVR